MKRNIKIFKKFRRKRSIDFKEYFEKTSEELSQLCRDLNIDTLWSWSRVHSYMNSKYEYF